MLIDDVGLGCSDILLMGQSSALRTRGYRSAGARWSSLAPTRKLLGMTRKTSVKVDRWSLLLDSVDQMVVIGEFHGAVQA
jgi:hypothetical protein